VKGAIMGSLKEINSALTTLCKRGGA